jgi:hypothetical protein
MGEIYRRGKAAIAASSWTSGFFCISRRNFGEASHVKGRIEKAWGSGQG